MIPSAIYGCIQKTSPSALKSCKAGSSVLAGGGWKANGKPLRDPRSIIPYPKVMLMLRNEPHLLVSIDRFLSLHPSSMSGKVGSTVYTYTLVSVPTGSRPTHQNLRFFSFFPFCSFLYTFSVILGLCMPLVQGSRH